MPEVVLYDGADASVTLAVVRSKSPFKETAEGFEKMGSFLKLMAVEDTVFDDDLVEVAGRSWARFDYWTGTPDDVIRNLTMATVVDGEFIVVSFNATDEYASGWWPRAEAMMTSVKLGAR